MRFITGTMHSAVVDNDSNHMREKVSSGMCDSKKIYCKSINFEFQNFLSLKQVSSWIWKLKIVWVLRFSSILPHSQRLNLFQGSKIPSSLSSQLIKSSITHWNPTASLSSCWIETLLWRGKFSNFKLVQHTQLRCYSEKHRSHSKLK